MSKINLADDVKRMDSTQLLRIETLTALYEIEDPLERMEVENLCRERARSLNIAKAFNDFLKQYKFKLATSTIPGGNVTKFVDQPMQLKCGDWICDKTGVRLNVYNRNSGEYEPKYATSVPTIITEILTNMDEGTKKARVCFYDATCGLWKSFLTPLSTIASNTKIVDLADRGIGVNSDNAKLFVRYLADLIAYNRDIIPENDAVDKLGWRGDEFVPYSEIKFDGEEENRFMYNAIGEKGTMPEWIDYTKEMIKNIYIRMQFGASFAAPLIEKVNALPFIVHYWGKTGAGKTVGMIAAMSVWGKPTLGNLTRTMDATVNACTSKAAFLGSIPFAADELQTIRKNGETYDKLIMSVTEGMGRERMYYNKMQKAKTWKTSFLFTGEEPITKENSGGGAKNRVIEVDCNGLDFLGGKPGNEVVEFFENHYGTIGPMYVQVIKALSKTGELKTTYNDILAEINEKSDTTSKQAMSMALILLGDKIASEYFFSIPALTFDDVKGFLKSEKDVDISERAYNFVMNLCAVNVNKFSENGNGEIWGKISNGEILINKDVLMRQLDLNGFSFDAVKKDWAEKGYLLLNSQKKYVHQTKCFGAKGNFIKLAELDICKDINTFDDLEKVRPIKKSYLQAQM